MTLEASVTLVAGAKFQYLSTLVHGEALRQRDTLYAEVGSNTSENLNPIILGLSAHFYLVYMLSTQKRAMRRRTRKPCGLKIRVYTDRKIDLNKYLDVLPGAKEIEKTCETDLDEMFLNSMTNIWSRQAYMQGFDCEPIALKICKHVLKYGNSRIYL